jgi:hypothetical protein
MPTPSPTPESVVAAFIARWSAAQSAERANYTLFPSETPASAAELASRFSRSKEPDIFEILQTLVTLGRARLGDAKGTFVR